MSDIDDFDISSILGMSSILNKEETNNGFNLKNLEREFLNSQDDNTDAMSNDDYEEDINPIISYDPVKEYNNMLEDLDSTSVVADNEKSYMTSYSNITMDREIESNISNVFTEEQANQNLVDSLFQDSSTGVLEDYSNKKVYDLSGENTDDMKLRLLEKIDNLKYELEEDGINLDRIPKVDFSSPLEEIENTAKLLMLKATRNRYSNMGEEFILALSNGLEILCNGEREFFGLKPDLTNCTDIVKVKLRRVKNETSQIVADVVEKYEIPPLMTVMIELIPALFLHSRRRSMQKASLISGDIDLSDDINEIRKF
jgi:hypothetical protein